MTRTRASLVTVTVVAALRCTPNTPPVSADAFDAEAPLNPTLDDGRTIYRGYDDHHPTCFVFVNEPDGGETEELECPDGALGILESCPSGKLYLHGAGDGCVCDPIGDEPPTLTPCPE